MPKILNQDLYDLAKKKADEIYSKPSAFKSGYIVKKYKELGDKFGNDNKPKNLIRLFQEKWQDVGHKSYPLYRPTVRINKRTPLTVNEIGKKNLKEQIKKKQIIKGKKNLSPFVAAKFI